jgi:hypothetical protein
MGHRLCTPAASLGLVAMLLAACGSIQQEEDPGGGEIDGGESGDGGGTDGAEDAGDEGDGDPDSGQPPPGDAGNDAGSTPDAGGEPDAAVCGGSGEPCCSTEIDSCDDEFLECAGGVCRPCGQVGGPCCETAPVCETGIQCVLEMCTGL